MSDGSNIYTLSYYLQPQRSFAERYQVLSLARARGSVWLLNEIRNLDEVHGERYHNWRNAQRSCRV